MTVIIRNPQLLRRTKMTAAGAESAAAPALIRVSTSSRMGRGATSAVYMTEGLGLKEQSPVRVLHACRSVRIINWAYRIPAAAMRALKIYDTRKYFPHTAVQEFPALLLRTKPFACRHVDTGGGDELARLPAHQFAVSSRACDVRQSCSYFYLWPICRCAGR